MGQQIPALPYTMGKSQPAQGGPGQQPQTQQQQPPRTTQQKLQRLAEMSPFQGGQTGPPVQGFAPPQQPMMAGQQPAGQPAMQPSMPVQAGQPFQGSVQQPQVPAPFQQPGVQAPFQQPTI